MKTNCDNCPYGHYNPLSDICDNCMHDNNTGWFGFTDHRAGKHFNNEDEQSDYYKEHLDDDDYNEDNSII